MIKFCVRLVQRWLPEPFIFAILLTFVAAILAMPICRQTPLEVVENWGGGVWNLLAFAMQMALVLVCGSTLAAAPSVKRGIAALARIPKSPAAAIALVTVVSALACWLNWGFGLIVGVIFAKEIARQLSGVDYRLLIASAYSGFVVWHAGLSGSIPLTMATPGEALAKATNGALTAPVPVSQTILDPHNIVMVLLVIVAITVANTLMHPKTGAVVVDPALLEEASEVPETTENPGGKTPAQRMEHSPILSWAIALMLAAYLVVKLVFRGATLDLGIVIMIFLALGLMLSVTRRIGEMNLRMRKEAPETLFGMGRYMGQSLHGLTLGIVGCGRIGSRTAQLARAFGMKVMGYSRRGCDPDVAQPVSFDELLQKSDVVSLHCPLTEETRGLMNRDAFGKMKDSSFLINTARGAVVDTAALLEALESGKVAGAGLDVVGVSQGVVLTLGQHGAVHGDGAFPADIDHAQLTALQEVLRTQLITGGQGQGRLHRNGAAGDDTVDVAVHQLHVIGLEQIVDQKLLAQTLGVIGLYVPGRGCSTKLHGGSPPSLWKRLHFTSYGYPDNVSLPDVSIVQRFARFEKSKNTSRIAISM